MMDRITPTQRPRTATVSTGRVLRTERLTPHMIRVVLGGPGLAAFRAGDYADHYVKLIFPRPGVDYPRPLDLAAIRRDLPRESWPSLRTYTVRAWDAASRELTIDFVYHGDVGLAGPWAAAARPGDEIAFSGPGGAYLPDPAADWHLLAGDESALPAIAVALERMPAAARVRAFVEVSGPADEQELAAGADVCVVWVHRGARPAGVALVEAVREFDFPPGAVQAFVHGEANAVRSLRRLLRVDHGVAREQLSISGYWRRGVDEDGWQSGKAEWNRQVEEEEARTLG